MYPDLPGGLDGKESACNAGDPVWSVGWEDPLEKEMANHPVFLDWEIPGTEEPAGLQSMELQRVRNDLATKQQDQDHNHTCYSKQESSSSREETLFHSLIKSFHHWQSYSTYFYLCIHTAFSIMEFEEEKPKQ